MRKTLSKILFAVFVCSLLVVHFSLPVRADFQQAFQDYNFQLGQYKTAKNDFLVAKSTFQTYQTLTAKTDAIAKFKTVLKSRDQLISDYYTLLQQKLNETNGVTDDQKTTFSQIVVSEAAWLADQQTRIDSASSIDDLNTLSDSFNSRFPQMLNESKQTIANVLLAKESVLRQTVQTVYDNLFAKVGEIRTSGENTQIWDRWFIDSRNKLDLFDQKIAEGQKSVFNNNNNTVDLFQAQQKFSEANQYLQETLGQLKEIITGITS